MFTTKPAFWYGRNLIMITYKQHQDYALTLSSSTTECMSHPYDAHLYISNDVLTICMLEFFHAFLFKTNFFAIRPDL